MKKLSLIIISFFFIYQLNAQIAFDIIWEKSFGGSGEDMARSLCKTSDGDYFVLGWSDSQDGQVIGNHGNDDFWAIKMNYPNGLAQIPLGGQDHDFGFEIQEAIGGGYLLAGNTTSNDGQVSGNHGVSDAWLVKLNEGGSIDWQKCLGGSEAEIINDFVQTNDGGILLGASTRSMDGDVSSNHGWSDFWLVKLNANGDIEWEKTYGGTEWEDCAAIEEVEDNCFVMVGTTASNDGDVQGNHGSNDIWAVKVDAIGNILWQKCLGGSDYDEGKDVLYSEDGHYYVLGSVLSDDGDVIGHHGHTDFWIACLDQDGDLLWNHCYGGSDYDDPKAMAMSLNYIWLVGTTNSVDGDISLHIGNYDQWIVGIVPFEDGYVIEKSLGGTLNDAAYDVIREGDGIVLAGSTASNDGHVSENFGANDFWVVRMDWIGGLGDTEKEVHYVQPNPVENGWLNIQSRQHYYLELVSVSGEILLAQELTNGNQMIDIHYLQSGMYFVRMYGSDEIHIEKVIIN